LFHLIEVKKKCSLKIILKSILREILLCRRMNFRTVSECMMFGPQDYKSSGAEDFVVPQD
jgi:hypothetical protein